MNFNKLEQVVQNLTHADITQRGNIKHFIACIISNTKCSKYVTYMIQNAMIFNDRFQGFQ